METSNVTNQPGLYRHPESGAELVAEWDPITGSAQADGYVRVGFVYVGPKPEAKVESKKEDK